MNKAIVVLLDAADEWSNYVDADHAPVSLRKYMEREAEQIISSLPVEVSTSADADAMNITHGESYGSDWVYPTDSSTAPGPAPQGVAEVMELVNEDVTTSCSMGAPGYSKQNAAAHRRVEEAITAIITERDALRADAARYLWLRDAPQEKVEVFLATDLNETGWGDWNSWKDKDAGIDVAIAASKETK
jgi:hypothetical protein